mgnify:CR=1 FL=1
MVRWRGREIGRGQKWDEERMERCAHTYRFVNDQSLRVGDINPSVHRRFHSAILTDTVIRSHIEITIITLPGSATVRDHCLCAEIIL